MFKDMGLSITNAVRMFLTKVKNERTIPFEVKAPEIPNQNTQKAILHDKRIDVKSTDELLGQYDN